MEGTGKGLGESIVTFDERTLGQTIEIVRRFAERNELEHLLCDHEDTIERWCLRWLMNGWRDKDGRDMNQGVIYRQGGEKRLLPRWASMLLGYERGMEERAGGF